MSRQFEDLKRRWNKFRDRLGESDPVVSQWREELDAREASELLQKMVASRRNYLGLSLSRRSAVVERSAAIERMRTR